MAEGDGDGGDQEGGGQGEGAKKTLHGEYVDIYHITTNINQRGFLFTVHHECIRLSVIQSFPILKTSTRKQFAILRFLYMFEIFSFKLCIFFWQNLSKSTGSAFLSK